MSRGDTNGDNAKILAAYSEFYPSYEEANKHLTGWRHRSCITLAVPVGIYQPNANVEPDALVCFDVHRPPLDEDGRVIALRKDALLLLGDRLQEDASDGLAWTLRLRLRA